MLPSWCKTTVTVSRAPYVESRGTRVRDWPHATEHEVTGCSLQPASSSTAWADQRQPVTYDATLYAPPGADLEDGDRVTVSGATYAVDGAPMPWASPTGSVDHVTANLATWRG